MRKFCIVSDSFPPAKNSAASLIYSLAKELSKNYPVDIYSINADPEILKNSKITSFNFRNVKRKPYFLRALLELLSGFYFIFRYLFFEKKKYTDIIFYNPTILQVFFIKFLKFKNPNAKFSLILRDIFPDWAIDMKLINNPWVIRILKYFQSQNLEAADTVFCESNNKLQYMKERFPGIKFAIMYNWITPTVQLAKKKKPTLKLKLIYAGNVGLAQNVQFYATYLDSLLQNKISIEFFAFGECLEKLKLKFKNSENIYFSEILDFEQLNIELAKADGGLVFLDKDLDLDNIPGKILSYLAVGLPVFGFVNKGSELVDVVNKSGLGFLCDDICQLSPEEFCNAVLSVIKNSDPITIAEKAEGYFSLNSALEKLLNQ